MMLEPSLLERLVSPKPYHLLSWGSLLGMQLYQSQVMTKLCYQHLPMPQFTQLQRKVFPKYFALQTLLTLLVAVTYPSHSLLSLVGARGPPVMWSATMPLGLNLGMALLNWAVYGPRTSDAMMKRVRQVTVDERKAGNATTGQDSEAMKQTKRAFSRAHAMSIHLNAIAMLCTLWYGIGLAARLDFS